VGRFDEQGESWRDDAWSLVVDYVTPPDTSLRHRVRVHFLSEHGPTSLLRPGARFTLVEGDRVVAEGAIVA
jgi:hypothetical protein